MNRPRKSKKCIERGLAWSLGAIIQGLIMGGALTVALLKLMEFTTGAQIFRYQGF